MKNYKNLIEYLIDEEGLTFMQASKISKEFDNNINKYLESINICVNVKIIEIGDHIFSIIFENDKGFIISGYEFEFDNEEIFNYIYICDLEYQLNDEYKLSNPEEIDETLFEKIENISNNIILEDEGSVYTWDHIEYVNENGGLFECLKGACSEYGYDICDISDENSAYSIAYSWIYNNNKPSACLSYLNNVDY